jgi:hypothetical protein
MQYFKPDGDQVFAGDCMPFFHDGTFHLFYLLDEAHHAARDGLGGHQWAHATTTDLIHWTHHPLAIAITHEWEGSICTGSAFYDRGVYYAYYATRLRDRTEQLSLATSLDGVHYQKCSPNPFASPPQGYDPYHYRDPVVFRDDRTGLYHLLVTARLTDHPAHGRGGCLAHLTSMDLTAWDVQAPFLVPGLPDVPECPDYFFWNGWYYVLFSQGGAAHYRMSRGPFGPWHCPIVDTFEAPAAHVMKTAAFTGNRRLGAAWIGTRERREDTGQFQFGGHVIFREIIQNGDGTLGTTFPAEMVPPTGSELPDGPHPLTPGSVVRKGQVLLQARQGFEAALLSGVPARARVTATVMPEADAALFGLCLRGTAGLQSGYHLRFLPFERRVELFDQVITEVDGLGDPFTLDVVLQDDLIDVCIDRRRCLINRCPGLQGDQLLFFAHSGSVAFDAICVRPLVASSQT